jgi:hypothetical protein
MKFFQNIPNLFSKQTTSAKICLIFLTFILLLQTVGLFSYYENLKNPKGLDPWQPHYSNSNVPLLARWDSGWYIAIINYGYSFNENKNSTVAFFPLYPLLISGVSKIIPINYFYIGQFISWLALLGALLALYKLLRLDYSDVFSFRVLLYLLIFPWSFFLAAVYTESLFLLLVVSSFYYARKGNWPAASLLGFFAALTRISGILLLPALLYEFYAQNKTLKNKHIAWLALIPAGLLTFMLYLKLKTGYFLAFLYNQTTYERTIAFPLTTIWIDFKNTIFFLRDGNVMKMSFYALSLLTLGVCVILLIKKYREIRTSYLVFAILSILLPLCTGTTISLGRYFLSIFPIFIAAALVENKIFKNLWFAIGFITLIALTFSFVSWYFIV